MNGFIHREQRRRLGQTVRAVGRGEQHQLVARALALVGDDRAGLLRRHGEGHKRRGNVHLLERAAHGVLAAHGADAERHLRGERAQQRREGLAPAGGLAPQPLEILLERQIDVLKRRAGGDELAHAFDHGEIGPTVGILLGDIGIIAPGHERAVIRVAALEGNFLYHRLHGRALVTSAERHEHRARADGGVEPLGEPLPRADVQILRQIAETAAEVRGDGLIEGLRFFDEDVDVLFRTVGAEEGAADVHDRPAIPVHDKARTLRHARDDRRLEVLAVGEGEEAPGVLRRDHDGHALLRFTDRKLRAVEALILLWYRVEVDVQPVGQLADGDGHTARAEVVAALDHAAGLGVAKQALELALLGGVALLNLRTAALERLHRVRLGRARCAAAAVAARAPAKQDHDVAALRPLAADIGRRGRGDNRADLHALGRVAGVIEFIDDAGGKADLVAVGGIARGGGLADCPLGELAGERLAHGLQGAGRARQAHRAVDI